MSKVLPLNSVTIYRFLSSANEVVVSEPEITIRKSNGQIKLLYTDENKSSVMPNPFNAPKSGQWTVWTTPESEALTITSKKGLQTVALQYLHNFPTGMTVSSRLPIEHLDDQSETVPALEPDFVGQDYLYENETSPGVYERRLFKAAGTLASDWLELSLL